MRSNNLREETNRLLWSVRQEEIYHISVTYKIIPKISSSFLLYQTCVRVIVHQFHEHQLCWLQDKFILNRFNTKFKISSTMVKVHLKSYRVFSPWLKKIFNQNALKSSKMKDFIIVSGWILSQRFKKILNMNVLKCSIIREPIFVHE